MKLEDLKGRVIAMSAGIGTAHNKVLDVQNGKLKMHCDSGFVFYMSAENLEAGIASGVYEII